MSARKVGRLKEGPKKRDNGLGSVTFHAASQRWRARISIDGRQVERSFRTEDEAWTGLADLKRLHTGVDAPGATPTVAEVAEQWMTKRRQAWSETRVHTVRLHVTANIINHPIGRTSIDRVSITQVEAWLQEIVDRGARSEDTIATYRSELAGIFRWALRRKVIDYDPVTLAEWPDGMTEREEKCWLDLDQANRLVRWCTEEHEPWGAYFITMALLGLRPGEAASLRRSSIDFDAGTVRVTSAIKRINGTATRSGKTKTRRTRLLKARPEVLDALRRHLEVQDLAHDVYAEEWPTGWDDLVFLNTQPGRNAIVGRPPCESTLRGHLRNICTKAELPVLALYELRHTCASILLHHKMSPEDVAKMLGTSVDMLRHHYEHLLDPVLGVDAVTLWDGVLDQGQG